MTFDSIVYSIALWTNEMFISRVTNQYKNDFFSYQTQSVNKNE